MSAHRTPTPTSTSRVRTRRVRALACEPFPRSQVDLDFDLLRACRAGSRKDAMRALLYGADPRCCDGYWRTPLHWCVRHASRMLPVIHILIARGSSAWSKDAFEMMPLDLLFADVDPVLDLECAEEEAAFGPSDPPAPEDPDADPTVDWLTQ